jgi:hypothetical protein
MPTYCIKTVGLKRIRVTELDECGAVPLDADYVVSNGQISLTISHEMESGDEFVQKNGVGELCINERNPDSLKRAMFELVLCEVDPDLVTLMTGFRPEMQGSDVVGFRAVEGLLDTNFALEGWTKLAGGACTGGDVCYGYVLLPWATGAVPGDIVLENGSATFTLKGYTSSNSDWGTGPWDVAGTNESPGPLDDEILSDEPYLMRKVCVDPPAAACGALPVSGSPA